MKPTPEKIADLTAKYGKDAALAMLEHAGYDVNQEPETESSEIVKLIESGTKKIAEQNEK